jgi:hypothetical protein
MVGRFGSKVGSATVCRFASGSNLNLNSEKQTRHRVACRFHLKLKWQTEFEIENKRRRKGGLAKRQREKMVTKIPVVVLGFDIPFRLEIQIRDTV